MQLTKFHEIEIIPTSPFAFDPTFHKPDHFTSGDNEWEIGIKWQTWNQNGKKLGLKFTNKGVVEKPALLVEIYSDKQQPQKFVDELVDEIKYRYNLNLNLSFFYKRFEKDKILAPITQKFRGMRPGHPSSLYEYLIIGIVLQNATVRRSIQMFKALLETYGTPVEFDGKKLWCLWNVGKLQNIMEEELRALKVGYRAKSIKRIDEYFANREINEIDLREKDCETQREKLLRLYGVGPATVWYLLFDVFHHWGVFDHISPWEQKIYTRVFFNKNPENLVPVERILKRFEKYGEYKHLAVHYIWEDLWWKRKKENIPWLEKLIRI